MDNPRSRIRSGYAAQGSPGHFFSFIRRLSFFPGLEETTPSRKSLALRGRAAIAFAAMNATELLTRLRALGKPATAKTYRRHGAVEPVLGVSYADLGKLEKQIKIDHALALSLWKAGDHEARLLATKVADPERATLAEIDAWRRDLQGYPIVGAFSDFVRQTPHARACLDQWIDVKDEWTSSAGWGVLAALATHDRSVPDAELAPYVARIAAGIHGARNRTRHAMNGALIAIGGRGGALEKQAMAAAKKIGHVEVDHGDTDCKTPDAVAYIQKVRARVTKASAR
jgi:3-methyladenine DNA glycosylase AlkD